MGLPQGRVPPRIPLGLIVNPAARVVRRRFLEADQFWRGCLPEEAVCVTQSLGELDAAVARFRALGVCAIAILGGDGSLHHLVEALLRQYDNGTAPIVLPLAGGTMNGLARALATGGAPERVLKASIAALGRGVPPTVRSQYLLRVSDLSAGCTRYGFGFASGLVFRALQEYYRAPQPGMIDALRASVLPLRSALFGGAFFDAMNLEVSVAGAPWLPEHPHTVVASVTDNPLLWFRPFGDPLGDAPVFHLAALAMRPAELAPRLWSVFRGRCRHPRLRTGPVQEVTIRGESGYLIDGELYPSAESMNLSVTVGPQLRFFASAPS